jgi:hypothetical protein
MVHCLARHMPNCNCASNRIALYPSLTQSPYLPSCTLSFPHTVSLPAQLHFTLSSHSTLTCPVALYPSLKQSPYLPSCTLPFPHTVPLPAQLNFTLPSHSPLTCPVALYPSLTQFPYLPSPVTFRTVHLFSFRCSSLTFPSAACP